MIQFIKGIYFDQSGRIAKMIGDLTANTIDPGVDNKFLAKTLDMLYDLDKDIKNLIQSGDLDVDQLAPNNFIKYNTFHERLLTIELFRYLIIVNYGVAETYFKKKITRIYKEVNCLQNPPIVTTISNSENYYWALPSYDIIAVPTGEERNLLNLPDLFHEMGHLIFNQHEFYLKGTIETTIQDFYQAEILRVVTEQRSPTLITFYREKLSFWLTGWVMEFTCDLIATYLVGPAYAWTNLKLTTLSSGKDRVYTDSPSHPSDESRMRAIFYMLRKMGHQAELVAIEKSWGEFLTATNNPVPQFYNFIFPQTIIEKLADFVFEGCENIDLRKYNDQIQEHGEPISKILNDAWAKIFNDPENYHEWERIQIKAIGESL